eukprot:scaffold2679_cov251-Pinguiococcus_pyrenoidosus.AAC.20
MSTAASLFVFNPATEAQSRLSLGMFDAVLSIPPSLLRKEGDALISNASFSRLLLRVVAVFFSVFSLSLFPLSLSLSSLFHLSLLQYLRLSLSLLPFHRLACRFLRGLHVIGGELAQLAVALAGPPAAVVLLQHQDLVALLEGQLVRLVRHVVVQGSHQHSWWWRRRPRSAGLCLHPRRRLRRRSSQVGVAHGGAAAGSIGWNGIGKLHVDALGLLQLCRDGRQAILLSLSTTRKDRRRATGAS